MVGTDHSRIPRHSTRIPGASQRGGDRPGPTGDRPGTDRDRPGPTGTDRDLQGAYRGRYTEKILRLVIMMKHFSDYALFAVAFSAWLVAMPLLLSSLEGFPYNTAMGNLITYAGFALALYAKRRPWTYGKALLAAFVAYVILTSILTLSGLHKPTLIITQKEMYMVLYLNVLVFLPSAIVALATPLGTKTFT